MKALNRLLVGVASFALVMTWANVYSVPEAAADHCSRGEGTPSGPAIDGVVPSGKVARERICQPLELHVEVQNVNLPDGTVLAVDACAASTLSNIVGSITLRGGAGKLQLSKLDGDPTMPLWAVVTPRGEVAGDSVSATPCASRPAAAGFDAAVDVLFLAEATLTCGWGGRDDNVPFCDVRFGVNVLLSSTIILAGCVALAGSPERPTASRTRDIHDGPTGTAGSRISATTSPYRLG
jgi:hypothetical protein